jgi:hypothetical protein
MCFLSLKLTPDLQVYIINFVIIRPFQICVSQFSPSISGVINQETIFIIQFNPPATEFMTFLKNLTDHHNLIQ